MRNACDSDSRCGLAWDASARDAKSLAMRVERCEPLSAERKGRNPAQGSRGFRAPEPGLGIGLLVSPMTVGLLYGAGAETLIFVTGISGKYPKLFVSLQKDQSQLWIPRKPRKLVFGYPVLRSKPRRWIPELRFGHPPLRNFPKSFWQKLGVGGRLRVNTIRGNRPERF